MSSGGCYLTRQRRISFKVNTIYTFCAFFLLLTQVQASSYTFLPKQAISLYKKSPVLTMAEQIPRGGHSHAHHGHVHDETCATTTTTAALTTIAPFGIPLQLWKVIFQSFLTVINVVCWYWPLKSIKSSIDSNNDGNRLVLSLANAFSGGVFLSLALGHLIPECVHGFDPAIYSESLPYWCVLVGYMLIFFVEKVAFDAHDMLHTMQSGDANCGHSHSHTHTHASVTTNAISDTTPSTEKSTTGRSALILLGALGVHSVLEMMALGLADTFSDSALLTASIALHQPAESLALLVAFIKSGMSTTQIIQYLSIFSAMGPIGVGLGMAVNEYAAPIVDSILLAVVAGTFVYVGATEIIPEEWEDTRDKWKKFGALMTGIFFIWGVTQYTEKWHVH